MSSTGPTQSGAGAERRRYVRQPITLKATISIQGRKPLSCVVRDFCVAGVFVSLPSEYLHDLTKHTRAVLDFSLPVSGVEQSFRIGLVVYRVVGNGIGCGFSDPDPNAIRVLKQFAKESNQAAQFTDESLAETQSRFRPDYLKVKDALTKLCVQRTEALVQDLIRVADEALFLAARDAGNNREETMFLDGQNEFRKLSVELEADVPELMRKGIQIINSPLSSDSSSSGASDDTGELSLIDKDDFEEFLTVSELVSELEPKFKSSLFELEKRFQFLAKREIDEHSNPIGPEVMCNIFAESIRTMESDRQAVARVYTSLKKVLDAGLGRFYDEVNRLFIDNKILPVVEREKPKFKKTASSKRQAPQRDNFDQTQSGLQEPMDLGATIGSSAAPAVGGSGVGQTGSTGAAPPLNPIQPGLEPPGAPSSVPVNQETGAVPAANEPAFSSGPYVAPQGDGNAVPGVSGGAPGVPGGHYSPAPQAPNNAPGGHPPGPLPAGGQTGQFPSYGPGGPGGGVTPGSETLGPRAMDVTFGGFAGPPAVYTTPTLQQAYSTAQTQLALRRQLNQQFGGAPAAPPSGSAYSTDQIVHGLGNVQRSMAGEPNPGMLEVANIKEKIIESIKQAGGGDGHIGEAQADAIEIIANLFKSLINDSYLTTGAKGNLARLQAPVHKVALMDEEFFEATNHPVRQMLNRVALVDDTLDEQGIGQNERLAALIDQVNREFHDDMSIFNPVVTELDEILLDQRRRYQENVEAVVQASIEQQKILQDRRSKDPSMTDTQGKKKELPPEWNKWLDRVRAFQVGDRFIMNANTDNPFPVSLVWIGEDGEPFVLVDQKGHKVSTLTMQQVAMYLRRGTLKLLDPNAAAAVDRALFGIVNQMHEDVEAEVSQDQLTKFLARAETDSGGSVHRPHRNSNSARAPMQPTPTIGHSGPACLPDPATVGRQGRPPWVVANETGCHGVRRIRWRVSDCLERCVRCGPGWHLCAVVLGSLGDRPAVEHSS